MEVTRSVDSKASIGSDVDGFERGDEVWIEADNADVGRFLICRISLNGEVLAHEDTLSPEEREGDIDPDDDGLQAVRCEATVP